MRALFPEDFCVFVEAAEFRNDWRDLGLTEDDLLELQVEITVAPTRHPVIAGTGGLRKMRFAPRRLKRGKSGAVRVCYAHFPAVNVVLLVIAYAKGEQDTISPAHKVAIRDYLRRQEAAFNKGIVK